MRNFRLVLLAAAVTAVGSYSAFAGAGSPPDINPSVVGSPDQREEGRTALQEQQPEGTEDPQRTEKVAQAIADEFGVSKDEVLARHNEGIGFGALFKLYKLARAQGINIDELLATIPTDANGEREFAFGQRRKALTAEQRALYESGPKNLGRLVSAASKKLGKAPAEGGATGESAGETPQARGNGHVPPGQAKKFARQ